MNKTIVIIQARMGSTRLPGKVMLPLGDSIVLDYVVSRCRRIPEVSEVIVATSTLSTDDLIADWCITSGVPYFRGSQDDVLSRYYECAREFAPEYVIRVTSDCPFIDYELAAAVVETMKREPSDIVVYEGDMPRGLPVEMISFSALQRINEIGKEPRHREHVTYFAYEYPELFTRTVLQVPDKLRHPRLRITLDTEEDYALCRAVATGLGNRVEVSSTEVVRYLLQHPEVAMLNAHIEQKPVV